MFQEVCFTFVLYFCLVVSVFSSTPSNSWPPDALTFKFTARKFLFARCLTPQEIITYYPPQDGGDQKHDTYRDNGVGNEFKANCLAWQDILDGTLKGHPDFEPRQYMAASGTTGLFSYRQSPIRAASDGELIDNQNSEWKCNLTRVADDELVEQPSGIFTISYFNDPDRERNGECLTVDTTIPDNRWSIPLGESTTTGKDSFAQWYSDDRTVNRRVGFELTLERQLGGTYTYGSNAFFPLNKFPRCSIDSNGREDCSNGGRFWPLSAKELSNADDGGKGNTFGFTTEHHSFFRYNGGETFEFSGDDDVWVFINNRMAIQLGGLHEAYKVSVSLDSQARRLGIVRGKIYSFSMFHAERHTTFSNFFVTTTLVENCNVIKSGGSALDLATSPLSSFTVSGRKELGRGYIDDSRHIVLASPVQQYTSSYVFGTSAVNTAAGFKVTFTYNISPTPNSDTGFALVIHRRPNRLDDIEGGASGHLGLRSMTNSLIVALDFCKDRAPTGSTCSEHEISLRFGSSSDAEEFEITTDKYAQLIQQYKDGYDHTVEVVYYNEPNWVEVYMDDSLYLLAKDVTLSEVFQGNDAYVGFTSGSGANPADTKIKSWKVSTVVVDPRETSLDESNSTTTQELIADGSTQVGFTIRTRDACFNTIENGGSDGLAVGVLIPQRDNSTDERRELIEGSNVELADIVDNEDGSYTLSFSSTQVGETFSLMTGFGNCVLDVNATSPFEVIKQGPVDPDLDPRLSSCWTTFKESAVYGVKPDEVVAPPPPTEPALAPDGLPIEVAIGIGIGGGSLFVLFAGLLLVLNQVYRRKWNHQKKYAEKGRNAVLRDRVDFEKVSEYNLVSKQLLETSLELKSEMAHTNNYRNLKVEVERLKAQKAMLARQVKGMKQKAPNARGSRKLFRRLGMSSSRNNSSSLIDPNDI